MRQKSLNLRSKLSDLHATLLIYPNVPDGDDHLTSKICNENKLFYVSPKNLLTVKYFPTVYKRDYVKYA